MLVGACNPMRCEIHVKTSRLQARGEFCSFTPSEDNAGTCCGAIYPRPAVCYSCISRLNPPSHFVCPRPTRPGPPFTTVLPPVTVPDAATCGDLEVDDQESCSRFCSNADKQGGVTKASVRQLQHHFWTISHAFRRFYGFTALKLCTTPRAQRNLLYKVPMLLGVLIGACNPRVYLLHPL